MFFGEALACRDDEFRVDWDDIVIRAGTDPCENE
jgi:hypothetical protein